TATPPATEPAAAETPGATTVEPAESGGEVAPSEEAAEAGGEPSAEAGTTEPSDTPAGSAAEAPADQPREEAPATEDSSANPRSGHRGVFHLTALLQNTEEAAEATAETVSEATAAASDATPAASGPAAVSGESTGSAPVDTAESIPSLEAGSAVTTSEAGETETSTASAPTDSPDKPVEFQPIDEVRDVIRRRIAEDKITDQSVEQMNQLKGQLYGEFTAYFGSVLDAEAQGKERPAPPAALDDLTALAATHGLELGQTGPMSLLELRETPIGKSVDIDSGESLLRSLYGKELELYQPTLTYDLDGNRYLLMKTGDLPSKVPTLEEVRDQAVQAWKLRKAAELAKKHAEDLARQAKDSGKTLSDFFADDESVKVVRTDPFSWLTGGAVSRTTGQPQPFRLSEPDGIAAAGPDFMQAVFELGPSDVGAELSHDHSVAYVVRISEHQSAPEELHQDYLSEANTWDGLPTMARSHAQTVARVIQSQMMTDAGVEWDRPADQLTENQEEE
ncbi:MAG: hypothetical protein L0Z07_02335, partial [Planctomycetes bacterium]|nr:hypothetical protein [Planctomycetota bacterium]